jgi:putative transposase
MDDQVPEVGDSRRGCDASEGPDPGNLRGHDVKIMKGHVSKDHVHLLVSIPPQVTISRLMQWLKGKTAHKIMLEFPHIKKHYWGPHMWARGYFCCSTGNVTAEIIAEYIKNQQDDRDDDFRVDG